jgi:hypothetical protein
MKNFKDFSMSFAAKSSIKSSKNHIYCIIARMFSCLIDLPKEVECQNGRTTLEDTQCMSGPNAYLRLGEEALAYLLLCVACGLLGSGQKKYQAAKASKTTIKTQPMTMYS